MKYTLAIFSLSIFLGIQSYAQTDWELKKEEDGIKAYTRSREGIKFKEYKVVTEMTATLDQVMAIFKDFEIHTDLFPGTEDIKVLLDKPDKYITYIKFNIPFPARDRDAVFNNDLSYDPAEKSLHIEVHCLTDEYDTNPRLIQIEYCEGAWQFTDLGDGKLLVENNMIVDPAGRAPAWIVNSKTVDDPIKTLKNLRAMIDNDKYRGHSFTLLGN